jgi:predicted nucleic acid-binding protein
VAWPPAWSPPAAALVDTAILIDHLRGEAKARALLEGELSTGEPLFASVLTKVEVLAGALPRAERATRALCSLWWWLEVSEPIAERAGELARKRSRPGVDVVDYVIAATAESLHLPLWTRNVRHFPMLKGLKAPY